MLKRYLIHLQFPLIVSIGFGTIVGYCLAPILGVMIGLLVFIFGVVALKSKDFVPGINDGLYADDDFNNVMTNPTHPMNVVTNPAYSYLRGNIYHRQDSFPDDEWERNGRPHY